MPRKPSGDLKNIQASVALGATEKAIIESRMRELGVSSVSEYVRRLIRQDETRSGKAAKAEGENRFEPPERFHSTKLGTVWHGNSLGHLKRSKPGSVDLIVTSPPFGLLKKKSYGNEDAHLYCDWFRPFAEGFRKVLKEQGSLVIDLGGTWKKGLPSRSLYHFELLLMLCNEYGFHLCQEHYWWNPSKLPTPVEWVNIRRIRVKDAVNSIWWLSPTPWPKASNKRILAPYSAAMRDLLANGYDAKTRPSGHRISKKFGKDNGGAVPPNLLAIANTESNGAYLEYCREHGIAPHPARFPALLPEYFIRMLTDPGDRVLDPFAGSCVTGMVAESLGRKWDCVEMNADFLEGAKARFIFPEKSEQSARPSSYVIQTPCAVEADESPLALDGGQKDPLSSSASTSESSPSEPSATSGMTHTPRSSLKEAPTEISSRLAT